MIAAATFRPSVQGLCIRCFLAVMLLLVVALEAVNQSPVFRRDLLGTLGTESAIAIDHLDGGEQAALKLAHVLATPPFRTGLFGSSRALSAGTDDIGLAQGEFFNFSTSGESFRGVVALLELLHDAGRVPDTVVISFDNAELQAYANPRFLAPTRRWSQMGADFRFALTSSALGPRDVLRLAWRHLYVEGKLAREKLNYAITQRSLARAFGLESFAPPAPDEGAFRADGSRRESQLAKAWIPTAVPVEPLGISPALLERDFARLHDVAQGKTVIIYESLLHPAVVSHLKGHTSPAAGATRAALAELCARYGFRFVPAPDEPFDRGGVWRDYHHTPGKTLGAYLATILERRAPQ